MINRKNHTPFAKRSCKARKLAYIPSPTTRFPSDERSPHSVDHELHLAASRTSPLLALELARLLQRAGDCRDCMSIRDLRLKCETVVTEAA